MKTDNTSKIPILAPTQFDDHLYNDWKPWYTESHNEFHIARIESYKDHIKIPMEPHRRSVCFFIFLTEGKVVRSKGLTNYEVLPNNFFFLPADQITAVESFSPDVKGFYCHFNPEIFNDHRIKNVPKTDFPFFQITANPVVPVTIVSRIIQILEILEKEYQADIKEHFSLRAIYLLALLTEVSFHMESTQKQNNNAATILTQRYKDALSSMIYEKKTVVEYADFLKVTANHLNKSVKSVTGKSAHELLDEMRLLEAKVLLRQTSLSIGDIAFKMGQLEPSVFSRFFKSKTNMTPQQFRQT